jgi:hypothetical protein
MSQSERELLVLTQDSDQLWSEIRMNINAETGLINHLHDWAMGEKKKLSDEDKGNIKLLVLAGLMVVKMENMRAEIVEDAT